MSEAAFTASQPLSFNQILDRIYRLLKANLRLFLSIGTVPVAAMFLILGGAMAAILPPLLRNLPAQPDPQAILRLFLPAALIASLLQLGIFAIYLAAAVHAATQADSGIRITFREAYGKAWSQAGRVLGLLLLIYLIAFGPALVVDLAMIGSMGMMAVLGGGEAPNPALFALFPLEFLLYLAALVYGVLMGLRYSLAFPACITENLTAREALKRSSELTRGGKGRIFLVLLLLYAICYALTLVLMLAVCLVVAVGCLVGWVLHLQLNSAPGYVAMGLAGLLALIAVLLYCAATWATMTTALAVLYRDQRRRKESFPPAPPVPPVGVIASLQL